MSTFVYPGTFDPFTLGHEDIAIRAAKMCDKLVIAVSMSRQNCMFDIESRVKFIKLALNDAKKYEILPFSGLTSEFAKAVNADCIIRGVRTGGDFEFESGLAINYKYMAPDIENIMLLTARDCAHISSSVVRDLIKYNGNLNGYLSPEVARAVMGKN